MKIRNGFVSNSSTSSFFCFGIPLEDTDAMLERFLGKPKVEKTEGCSHQFDRKAANFCPTCGHQAWHVEEEEREIEELEEPLEKIGLDLICGLDGDYYIGLNMGNIGDKAKSYKEKLNLILETGKTIEKEFGKTPDFHMGAGYDG